MRRRIILLLLSLICLMATGCGSNYSYSANSNNNTYSANSSNNTQDRNDPFVIYNNLGAYHVKFTGEYWENGSVYYQKGDIYQEANSGIRYVVSDGVLGKQKDYYYNNYEYSYDYSANEWTKTYLSGGIDNNGFTGWKDKSNYDYSNGVYTLKGYIDIGQSDYYKVYMKNGHLVIEEKIRFDGFYIIEIEEYVETNSSGYNLKLPM